MSLDEARIAIATHCGIEIASLSACCSESSDMEEAGICPRCHDGCVFEPDAESLPDYLASLDAMHEAIKTLSDAQQISYIHFLREAVKTEGAPGSFLADWDLCCSEASQQAKAFLQSVGKWKESTQP